MFFNNGMMDEIRCDEPSYLVWKWENGKRRGNAIVSGSSLRVKRGEAVVFVYHKDGKVVEKYIEGPYDGLLETGNIPFFASIRSLAYGGGTPFQAEVYFINLARIIQIKFGVPYFDVFDPRFKDFGVPVCVRGTVTFQISDVEKFIELHRLSHFSLTDFQLQIKDAMIRYVKKIVTNLPTICQMPLVQIERCIENINEYIEQEVKQRLFDEFGVDVSSVDLSDIELDKTSEGYYQLMAVTKDVEARLVQAKSDVQVYDLYDKQRLDAKNYEEVLRMNREERQYATRKQTESQYMDAFKIEKQTEIGVAGAEALGKMGENASMGEGLNMASMMTQMTLGGIYASQITEAMNNITPPPIPSVEYHIVLDQQVLGPYSIKQIQDLVKKGTINGSTWVYKAGMEDWKRLEEVGELKGFLNKLPPIPNF